MGRTQDPGREFADIWGEQVRANRHLRAVIGGLGALVFFLLLIVLRLANVDLPKPVVIRVDEVGRAEALAYEAVEAKADPLDPTTKYFLAQFLDDFYSRQAATAETAWGRSLRFLSTELANGAFEADSESVARVAAGLAREDRSVEGVVLRVLPSPQQPHGATADFDLVTRIGGEEASRERWSVSLQFVFLERVPAELLPYNPLGLVITFLQADRAQAFG